MHDLGMHSSRPGNINRLFDRIDDVVRFIADVREIGRIVLFEHRTKRPHFV